MSVVELKRAKEIGSYFDIDPKDIADSNAEDGFEPFGKALYLSTCRSAISIALQNSKTNNKVALLPGFTCHAVVDPFVKSGFTVIPYSIKENLEIDLEDLIKKVYEHRPGVILVHDYFGFDTNRILRERGLLEKFQSDGVVIINDQTQSMFSSYAVLAGDYHLGSIRKWMGIPDGAYLLGIKETFFGEPDRELEEVKVNAMVYKHHYLFKDEGKKDKVLDNYRKAESLLDSRERPYVISNTTKSLFTHYNIEKIKKSRQVNGRILLDYINENPELICPFLSVSHYEIPFYIPVLVTKHRKEFQEYLAQNNVYATVIWGCPDEFVGKISDETNNVYEQILCIPCDQRYNKADMAYIGGLISDFSWDN